MMTPCVVTKRSLPFSVDTPALGDLQSQVHHLESTLVQRQEEIAQLRAELAKARPAPEPVPAGDAGQAMISQLAGKLADADAWVLRLARERHDLGLRNATLGRMSAAASRRCQQMSDEMTRLYERNTVMASGLRADIMALQTAIARLSVEKDAAESGLRADLAALQADRDAVERDLRARGAEIDRIDKLVRYKDDLVAQVEYRAELLRRMCSVLTRDHSGTVKGRLAALLPPFLSRRRKLRSLKAAGLFDGESYLALHGDVARSRTDPLRHYINHGIREGRGIGL